MTMICVIVAHPDDESLWFGGTLLIFREAEIETVIVCLTNASNPVRATEFKNACQKLGVKSLMLDYPDGGLKKLPDFGNDVEQLLQQNSVQVSDLTCVITCAPHGNERSHPQHIQCFNYVRKWCCAKNLPLGLFSEKLIPELKIAEGGGRINNQVTLHDVRLALTPLMKDLINLLAATPISLRGYIKLIRNGYRLFQVFGSIQSMFILDIDTVSKQALLETYASQIEGLKQYVTYHYEREYLYLSKRQTARQLIPYLQ